MLYRYSCCRCEGEVVEFTYLAPGTYETRAIESVLVQSYPNYIRMTPTFRAISDVRRDMTIRACFEDEGCVTQRLYLLALSGAAVRLSQSYNYRYKLSYLVNQSNIFAVTDYLIHKVVMKIEGWRCSDRCNHKLIWSQ